MYRAHRFTEGPAFIDTLFTVLRTKSYLPYTDSLPTQSTYPPSSNRQSGDVGIPIPLDSLLRTNPPALERGQKRLVDYDDALHAQRPAKGPRLSSDAEFARYSNGYDGRAWTETNDIQGMGDINGQHIQTYQPPDRRGICRDYHSALFSHGLSGASNVHQKMAIVLVACYASTAMAMTLLSPHSCFP